MGVQVGSRRPDPLAGGLTPLPSAEGHFSAALARQRRALVVAISLLTAAAWAYTLHLASAMRAPSMQTMSMPATTWSPADAAFMFVMWAVMMVAMMLPSATPAILLFERVCARRAVNGRASGRTAAFVAGYLAAWLSFSVAATWLNWFLHAEGVLTGIMGRTTQTVGALLLIAAGVFQFTPVKDMCLRHCRSPIGFLTARWREGNGGALRMGVEHGFYCVGCCWLLMALLFALGIMNLAWIAALAVFVLIEKVAPFGKVIGRMAGAALVVWGGFLLASL